MNIYQEWIDRNANIDDGSEPRKDCIIGSDGTAFSFEYPGGTLQTRTALNGEIWVEATRDRHTWDCVRVL